jgi:hypothetical protein
MLTQEEKQLLERWARKRPIKYVTPLRPNRGKPAKKKASALRQKPERDPKYRAWVRGWTCVVCRLTAELGSLFDKRVEAAHMGPRGLSQKSSDYTCIPLCPRHHRTGNDSAHRLGKKFATHHGINIRKIQAELRRAYRKERPRPITPS